MLSPSLPRPSRPRGVIAAKVAVCMPVLVGVVALSLDVGMMYDLKRREQSAADAAALAAAGELFRTYTNSSTADDGADPDGTAVKLARAAAAANGFEHGVNATVTVNIPPKSGNYQAAGAAEVVIESNQFRAFSSIFGAGDIPIRARSVGRGQWVPQRLGILVLDPTSPKALTVSGTSQGSVPYSGVIVNSASPSAAYGMGTTATLTAKSFDVTGNVSMNGGGEQFLGPITTGTSPTPDPLRDIPQPNPATMPVRNIKDAVTAYDPLTGVTTYYLEPGVYDGGLSFSGKSSVKMAPGIYYMRGSNSSGGFSFTGNEATSLDAQGVMVFNDPGTGGSGANMQVKITGNASINWTPPPDGLYKGITLFQARGCTTPLAISGGGNMNITGCFYAPDALLQISGNGVNHIGTLFITGTLEMSGTGTYIVDWDPQYAPKIRLFGLVE